jgi:hypothetical protein
MKQTISSEFGSASRKKQDFFNALFVTKQKVPAFDRTSYDTLVRTGGDLIKAAEAVVVSN